MMVPLFTIVILRMTLDRTRKKARDAWFYQAVNMSGAKGSVFFAGGWANGKAMPQSTQGARLFSIVVQFCCKPKGSTTRNATGELLDTNMNAVVIYACDAWGRAAYRLGGLDSAPSFARDAGFPFNPNAVATDADRRSWSSWGRTAFFSRLAWWLGDASTMYRHYRGNTGADMQVDYQRAYNEDETIQRFIDDEVTLMKKFAISTLSNGATSFEIIGDLQGIPNGTSENWQKTIGAHRVYGHGIVTVDAQGIAAMVVTFYMEDVYNFNPGQTDIASRTPDAVNGRFSELGWAREFRTFGTLTQTITW